MNGFELAGRKIRVGRPHMAPGSTTPQIPGVNLNNIANAAAAQALPGVVAPSMDNASYTAHSSHEDSNTTTTSEAQGSSTPASTQASQSAVTAPAAASGNKKVAEAASKAAKIAQSFASGGGISQFGQQNPNCRIYVGSVPFEMAAEHVQQIFEPFGRIVSCNMLPPLETSQPGQKHRGYGFLEFDNEESANTAIQTMNGFSISGRALKVNRATSPGNAQQTNSGGFGAAYWPS